MAVGSPIPDNHNACLPITLRSLSMELITSAPIEFIQITVTLIIILLPLGGECSRPIWVCPKTQSLFVSLLCVTSTCLYMYLYMNQYLLDKYGFEQY